VRRRKELAPGRGHKAMAMVEAALGLTFVCSSIAAMLSQVDRRTGTTMYSQARVGHRTNEQLMDADDMRVADRIPFEPREYVGRLSPEIAASLPEKRGSSGAGRLR